jgi:phage tail sheath protein FI
MAYTSPGVYISEKPFTTSTVTGPTTSAAAFLGTSVRGPVTPTLVDSWSTYKALFGDVSSAHELGYAVYQFFANGGRNAFISRVVGASSVAATGAVAGVYNSNVTASIFSLRAANVGAWGNSLTVEVSAGLNTTSRPTFNLVVKNSGTEVERWSELSLNPEDGRFVDNVVNNYSTYIATFNTSASSAGASYSVTAATATLTGGADGAALTDDTVAATQTAWANTLRGYDTVQGQLLFNLVAKSNATIVNDAITYVEGRGDSFLIIDPLSTATTTSTITAAVASYSNSSYAAVYYPMLKTTNPAASGSASLRDSYPGGAIAGLYTRVDIERNVAKAPAGYAYDLRGVYGVTKTFTESEIGVLYSANINTLKAIPAAGVIVNGARTLKKTDITKYIPVRRSLNFIKANVNNLTQYAIFEPNGERLWSDISARVSNFLSSFWATGGLKGNSAAEAYFVTCDSTNNTSVSMEQGIVNVEIGVALQSPAEFIVITVSQFVGGNQIQETL